MLYLCVDAQRSGVKLSSSNTPVGIMSAAPSRLWSSRNQFLYLSVPAGVDSFTITLYAGAPNENVKVGVYRPDGTLAATGETSLTEMSKAITVPINDDAGPGWKLQIQAPSQGILDDYRIALDAAIPAVCSLAPGANFAYAPFGSMENIALMVDKVMNGSTNYQHAEWMVQEAAAAGFNVYVARKFHNDSSQYVTALPQLQQLAQWCEQYGMKTMVWMRGTLAVDGTNPVAIGKRYLPETVEAPLWSPNSDELWAHLTNWIVQYAQLSVSNPAIEGVFLDFENYSGVVGASVFCYHLSYDDIITSEFSTAYNIIVPVAAGQRKAWLIANGLHDEFSAFQLDRWNERCKALRTAVDAVNPRFRFMVYPFMSSYQANNSLFLSDADAPIAQLSSAQAPIIHAEHQCYIPRYSAIHDAESHADANRQSLSLQNDRADLQGVPYMLLGGLDPLVSSPVAPGYNARTAVLASGEANGFWVFYEGPTYPSMEHTNEMNGFLLASQRIADGDYAFAEMPYSPLRSWSSLFPNGIPPVLSGPPPFGTYSTGVCKVRGKLPGMTVVYTLSCQAGIPVSLGVQTYRVNSALEAPIAFEVRPLANLNIRNHYSTLMPEQSGLITFTPPTSGVYLLAVGTSGHLASLTQANVAVGIYAAQNVGLFKNTTSFYVNAPSGSTDFTLTMTASGQEHVKVSIYDPAMTLRYQPQTTTATPVVDQSIDYVLHGAGTWRLLPGAADVGYFEDYGLRINGVPPVLGLHPHALFDY